MPTEKLREPGGRLFLAGEDRAEPLARLLFATSFINSSSDHLMSKDLNAVHNRKGSQKGNLLHPQQDRGYFHNFPSHPPEMPAWPNAVPLARPRGDLRKSSPPASLALRCETQTRVNLGVNQDSGFPFGFEPWHNFRQRNFVDGDVLVRHATALAGAPQLRGAKQRHPLSLRLSEFTARFLPPLFQVGPLSPGVMKEGTRNVNGPG